MLSCKHLLMLLLNTPQNPHPPLGDIFLHCRDGHQPAVFKEEDMFITILLERTYVYLDFDWFPQCHAHDRNACIFCSLVLFVVQGLSQVDVGSSFF